MDSICFLWPSDQKKPCAGLRGGLAFFPESAGGTAFLTDQCERGIRALRVFFDPDPSNMPQGSQVHIRIKRSLHTDDMGPFKSGSLQLADRICIWQRPDKESAYSLRNPHEIRCFLDAGGQKDRPRGFCQDFCGFCRRTSKQCTFRKGSVISIPKKAQIGSAGLCAGMSDIVCGRFGIGVRCIHHMGKMPVIDKIYHLYQVQTACMRPFF